MLIPTTWRGPTFARKTRLLDAKIERLEAPLEDKDDRVAELETENASLRTELEAVRPTVIDSKPLWNVIRPIAKSPSPVTMLRAVADHRSLGSGSSFPSTVGRWSSCDPSLLRRNERDDQSLRERSVGVTRWGSSWDRCHSRRAPTGCRGSGPGR